MAGVALLVVVSEGCRGTRSAPSVSVAAPGPCPICRTYARVKDGVVGIVTPEGNGPYAEFRLEKHARGGGRRSRPLKMESPGEA